MRSIKAMIEKPNERDKIVKKLTDSCVRHMRGQALVAAGRGDSNPSFGAGELMNAVSVPDDFELRWDVMRGIVDAMTLAVKTGMAERHYRGSGSSYWTYAGTELKKAKDKRQRAVDAEKKKLRAAAKKRGVTIKLDKRYSRPGYRVEMSDIDFMKLAGRKS